MPTIPVSSEASLQAALQLDAPELDSFVRQLQEVRVRQATSPSSLRLGWLRAQAKTRLLASEEEDELVQLTSEEETQQAAEVRRVLGAIVGS